MVTVTSTLQLGSVVTIDACFYRGDTWSFVLTITDADTAAPLDLTGSTLAIAIDREFAPVDATTNKTTIAGVLLDQVTNTGQVQFTLTTASTDEVGVFFHDFQLVDNGGGKRTIASGKWQIVQDRNKA